MHVVEPAETWVLVGGLREYGFKGLRIVALQLGVDISLCAMYDRQIDRRFALQCAYVGECFAVPIAEFRYVRGNDRQGTLVFGGIVIPASNQTLDAVFIRINPDRGFRTTAIADQALEVSQPHQLTLQRL